MRYIQLILLASVFLFACKQDKPQQLSSGDTALDELNDLVNAKSGDDGLLYQRAALLAQKGSYAEAVVDLKNAISIDSLKPEYFHTLSDVFMDYYKSRQALLIMEQAGDRFPERIPTLLKLSETQLILKDHSGSIRTVNNILALDAQNAEAYFMLGLNFAEQGDTTRAIGSFQTAVENDPELIDAWLYIGSLYENQNDKKALQYYDAAINANPQSVEAKHHKAYYLQNNDKMMDAINEYREINLIDKSYATAYLNKGILYLEMDSLDRAYEEFNILVGVDPKNANGYFYRGLANQMKNKLTAAKSDYNAAISLDPEMDKARRALGDLPSD